MSSNSDSYHDVDFFPNNSSNVELDSELEDEMNQHLKLDYGHILKE